MEPDASKVALIVLGAGLGSRFGQGDKLGAMVKGRPVAHHVLSALEPFDWGRRILVHHAAPQWSRRFAERGYHLIENADQGQGMLSSLHLGAMAAGDCPRAMICLADMPLISNDMIAALLTRAGETGCDAVATRSGDYKGPPAIIATHLLKTLPRQGEGGARALLKDAVFVDCQSDLLRDVDTIDDLKALNAG